MVDESRLPFDNDTIHNITRSDVSADGLQQILKNDSTEGVSICVRTDRGSADRGGYLFHYIEEDDKIRIEFFPFNQENKTRFDNWNKFERFVKHAIGEESDKEMYERSLQIVTRIE
jgi:hypothetical protein